MAASIDGSHAHVEAMGDQLVRVAGEHAVEHVSLFFGEGGEAILRRHSIARCSDRRWLAAKPRSTARNRSWWL